MTAATATWRWRDVGFTFAGTIEPQRAAADGTVIVHAPQSRYANKNGIRLNKYGSGTFWRFRLTGLPKSSGVYV